MDIRLKDLEKDIAIRQRLLQCATDLFVEKGYEGTSVREIVAAAGVTPPVLYYYFKSKEGIYLEIMREAHGEFEAVLAGVAELGGTAEARLRALIGRVLVLFRTHIKPARLMYAVHYGPTRSVPEFRFDEIHTRFNDAVLTLIRQGMASGEFEPSDPEVMMWGILGVVNLYIEMELCHPERSLGEEGLLKVLDLIFLGVRPKGTESRGSK
jgi:AcrR family transcriptional regulator